MIKYSPVNTLHLGGLIYVRIHARAFVAAAEASRCGLWHVVDDKPVSDTEFSTTFADRLDAPTPKRVQMEEAHRELGDGTVDLLTNPIPTSNDTFKTDIGWEPEYPTYEEGLDQVETWASSDYLV